MRIVQFSDEEEQRSVSPNNDLHCSGDTDNIRSRVSVPQQDLHRCRPLLQNTCLFITGFTFPIFDFY